MTQSNLSLDDLRRLAVLIEKVQTCDHVCVVTGKKLNRQEVLVNIALGFENEPHDFPHLASELDVDAAGLQKQIRMYIASRPCYRAAWEWAASETESEDEVTMPASSKHVEPNSHDDEFNPARSEQTEVNHGDQSKGSIQSDPIVEDSSLHSHWNAGEMGCGELVLKLRKKLMELKPRDIIRVTALDPGAPEDIPAWCRMTRHSLLKHEHPEYWIQKRDSE